MISKKLLRMLPVNKSYVVYDNIYNYSLIKYKGGAFRLNVYGSLSHGLYIYQKDLENLILEARDIDDDDLEWHYKNEYVYKGYTNSYKCICSEGGISVHSNFYGFHDLNFFGENKGEETVKELMNFKKTRRSNRINTKYYKNLIKEKYE